MKELFINSSFNFINKHNTLDHYNEVKIKYGLEVMYHFITKSIIIFLIAFILNIFKESLVFFIFYGFLRKYGYGIHAKSNIGCWISSITTCITAGLLIKYVYFYNNVQFILMLISILSYIFWAPADTKSKPLIDKNIRHHHKLFILSLSITYLFIYMIIQFSIIKKVIVLSMVLEAILINPTTYKLCGRTFNNYRSYI